jgi:hypothetical protein
MVYGIAQRLFSPVFLAAPMRREISEAPPIPGNLSTTIANIWRGKTIDRPAIRATNGECPIKIVLNHIIGRGDEHAHKGRQGEFE